MVFGLEVHYVYKVEVVPNVVLLNDVFVEHHVLVLSHFAGDLCMWGCMGKVCGRWRPVWGVG